MTSLFVLAALLSGPASASPVVVELFTSQGCSSCPDADALLSSWGMEGFKAGRLIPLSFDVDYWNYLGWKDVFSAPLYSRRQRGYAQAIGDRVYTPQMVVAGREAFVGSDSGAARKAAERFAGLKGSAVSVSRAHTPRLALSIEAAAAGARPQRVMLAIFENELFTRVTSGENGGRTLRNDFVVRRLVDLGPASGNFKRLYSEPLDKDWRPEHAGAAVFLQDPETFAITGAASIFPLSKPL